MRATAGASHDATHDLPAHMPIRASTDQGWPPSVELSDRVCKQGGTIGLLANRQWHAIVIIAGAMIRKRTAPQRQPASQGKDGCFIRVSRRCCGALVPHRS